ncbi:MAG: hypothetical protein R3B07_26960 [Polyangiaceae bacterium]
MLRPRSEAFTCDLLDPGADLKLRCRTEGRFEFARKLQGSLVSFVRVHSERLEHGVPALQSLQLDTWTECEIRPWVIALITIPASLPAASGMSTPPEDDPTSEDVDSAIHVCSILKLLGRHV